MNLPPALTTMDWGLRSIQNTKKIIGLGTVELQDTWWGKFTKTPIQGKVHGTPLPMVCKGKMNVEAISKQGKSSKGVLTVKVAKGMLDKLFSFTTALMHDWKMYGAKKENGDIEIKLTLKQLCLIES